MSFWEFCNESPVVVLLAVFMVTNMVIQLAEIFK